MFSIEMWPSATSLTSPTVPVVGVVVAFFSFTSRPKNAETCQQPTTNSISPRITDVATGYSVVTLQSGCHLDTICSLLDVSDRSDSHKRPK